MKRLVLASLVASFALAVPTGRAAPAPDQAPIVILVSIDGLAAFNFDDPRVDIPTIRWMAANGARAAAMETVFPSVTWPTHTTLVTGVPPGRHGVLANSYYDRAQNKKVPLLPDPLFDKEEIVTAPTIYDVAHLAGLRTAGVNWPASRAAKHLDWQVNDVGDQAAYEKAATPALLAELKAKGIPYEKQGEWAKSGNVGKAARDWMYTRIAQHLLREHTPNVLVIHYVTVDSFAHTSGGRSPEVWWGANDSDNRVRDLIETVKAAGLAARTTIFVVADHGFADYSKSINVNALLRTTGLLNAPGSDGQVQFVGEGGAGMLYIRDAAQREKIAAELLPALAAIEGIEAVIGTKDFGSIGHLTPDQNPREPDIFIAAKDGYSFGENPASKEIVSSSPVVKGNHGYHFKNPLMDATFVAWGAAIKPGTKLGRIRNVDVAPTMAAILGLRMDNVEGRALKEILK